MPVSYVRNDTGEHGGDDNPTASSRTMQTMRLLSRCGMKTALWAGLLLASPTATMAERDEDQIRSATIPLLRQFCFDCHGHEQPEARFALETIAEESTFGQHFRDWRKALEVLERQEMPPPDAQQPTDAQREELMKHVRDGLHLAARQHADDPGRTVIRRLTSAEFAFTIQDLTGLDLRLDRDFVSDAVGGEGFTNVGLSQFLQDSTLQRYLDAAKTVAAHAVIGAGPLQFHDDPGSTGLELSAITRIQGIYRDHGFRALAGEGGEPFGMDCFSKAFHAAWRFQHREALGTPQVTLAQLGEAEGLTERFVGHIWSIVTQPAPSYPISEVVEAWQALPAPDHSDKQSEKKIRLACDEVFSVVQQWHARLIRPTSNAEDSPTLNERLFDVAATHSFTAPLTQQRVGGGGIVQERTSLPVRFRVVPGIPNQAGDLTVTWKNARVRTRRAIREPSEEIPLRNLLSKGESLQTDLDVQPLARPPGDNDFVMAMGESLTIHLDVPEDVNRVELLVDVELNSPGTSPIAGEQDFRDGVVLAEIMQVPTSAEDRTLHLRNSSVILSPPGGKSVRIWQDGIHEFIAALPFVSHREAAPSDRDPIPEPFDNAYNMPERDWYHINVKYHRDDDFLFDKILDDPTREQLEEAWADLLSSFEHHDNYLKFTCDKLEIELGDRRITDVDEAWIAELSEPAKSIITRLRSEYVALTDELLEARPRHMENALQLAERAWRRPLSELDQDRLQSYYDREFVAYEHDHSKALRSLLARILVSPEFLYRAERPSAAQPAPISDWELASRLSYLLWSSVPDDELRAAAAEGILHVPDELERQVHRMLRHQHARRMATEFFGQWLGFYQFDRYAGVDHQVFPEFTEELREMLLEEATRFFEHLIREDRPVHEILFADYGFLNADLASHYQIPGHFQPNVWQRVDGLTNARRGGVLGLGAVLVANSGAPQRTSPVRRGDWILRRLLSTPVPPPPADAGSIPAAEVLGDGQTIRQRLELHRNQSACMSCHSRIDPLGFALENFDSLGRWRETYLDGNPVNPSGTLTNGKEIVGWTGLREHLRDESERFERTLCTKLLGYATGRAESISDLQLIEEMLDELRRDARFSSLILKIVKSPQFRYHRGREVVLDDADASRPLEQDGDER